MGIFDEIMEKIPDNDGADEGESSPEAQSLETGDNGKKKMHEYSDDFVKEYGPRKD